MKRKIESISAIVFTLICANFFDLNATVSMKTSNAPEAKISVRHAGENLKNSDILLRKNKIVSDKKVKQTEEKAEKNKEQSKIFAKIERQKLKKIVWISAGILAVETLSFITYWLLKRRAAAVPAGTSLLAPPKPVTTSVIVEKKEQTDVNLKKRDENVKKDKDVFENQPSVPALPEKEEESEVRVVNSQNNQTSVAENSTSETKKIIPAELQQPNKSVEIFSNSSSASTEENDSQNNTVLVKNGTIPLNVTRIANATVPSESNLLEMKNESKIKIINNSISKVEIQKSSVDNKTKNDLLPGKLKEEKANIANKATKKKKNKFLQTYRIY